MSGWKIIISSFVWRRIRFLLADLILLEQFFFLPDVNVNQNYVNLQNDEDTSWNLEFKIDWQILMKSVSNLGYVIIAQQDVALIILQLKFVKCISLDF